MVPPISMESRGVLLEEHVTHRGTHVEMFQGPYGIACYMDGLIQSSEADEGIYHRALVQPILKTHPKRVMIIGGGEGATAREVLKGSAVETVDMYEWDKDVVQMFQTSYPQWANGAWADPRLTIYPENIMEAITSPPDRPYDAIIVDLFDPSEENEPPVVPSSSVDASRNVGGHLYRGRRGDNATDETSFSAADGSW